MIIWAIGQPCSAQVTLGISPAYVTHSSKLDMRDMTLNVSSSVHYTGDVELHLFPQPYNPAAKPLYISQRFNLENAHGLFYFEDLFNKSELQLDKALDGLCVILFDRNGYRPLGMQCVNLIQSQGKPNDRSGDIINDKQNKKWVDYTGSVGYEMNYAQGQYVDYNNGQEWFYILEADAELSVAQIPINFKALYSNNDDPYLGYDLNRVTSYFDVQKWRAVLRKKAESILEKKKDQLLEEYPEYQKYKAKYDMVQRILSNKSVEQEIKDLEGIPNRLKELNLSDVEQLLRETQLMEDELERIEKAKADILSGIDSTSTKIQGKAQLHIDSLNQIKAQIETEYKEFTYLKSLALKSEGYQKIMNLRDTAQTYIVKARKVEEGFNTYKKRIINDPTQMYALVKEHGLAEGQSEFLSRIDELRLGVIHPNYAELSLQHGQQKGFAFGYSGSNWNIHTFLAKNRTRGIGSSNRDTLQNNPVPLLIGAKLALKPSENLESSFFAIHSLSTLPYPDQVTNSHLGFIQQIQWADDQRLDAEFVWSGNNEPISADTEGNPTSTAFRNALQEMAMRTNYQGRSADKKLSYTAEAQYYGPRYFDFNDSFIRRNSIQIQVDGRYSIKPDIWIGSHTSFDFGNIWSTASSLNQLYSIGLSTGITKSNLPGVQYLLQWTQSDYDEVDIRTMVHNANVQKAYTVSGGKWNSILNVSLTDNTASADTLNTTITGIFLSQQIEIPALATLMVNGNYTQISFTDRLQQDWSTEIRIPIQISKFQMTAGLKWVHTDEQGNLGWSLDANWSIHKKVNLSVLMDSLWLTSKLDQYGQVTQQYNANYQLKFKYNL